MKTYIKEYNKLNKNIEIYDSIFQPFIEYMEEKYPTVDIVDALDDFVQDYMNNVINIKNKLQEEYEKND